MIEPSWSRKRRVPRIRFAHAADLHLDSPFKGLRADAPGHVADALYAATFKAWGNIVDLCIAEQVDALLVAGDIYDGADRSLRAQLKFVEELKKLDEAGVRSFVCHGNHDPLDGWEARLDYPPSCKRFGPEWECSPAHGAARATEAGQPSIRRKQPCAVRLDSLSGIRGTTNGVDLSWNFLQLR